MKSITKINKFEDLLVWQKSIDFTVNCRKTFRSIKDYSFLDQIFRATMSISNNIAEGFERMGDKEFCKFLFIAKGSCGEVRSMLHLANKLEYAEPEDLSRLLNDCSEISKMIFGLIKSIKD